MKPQYINPEDVIDESVYDHGFNDAIDEVLEILDSKYSEFIGLVKVGVQPTPNMLQNSIRLAVLALKEGEHE